MKIRIDKIKVPKERLRYSSGKSINDLKNSMKEIGLIHPIVVNEVYKLIAGYRRLKSAKQLGWKEIDAKIIRDVKPYDEFLIELHENWKRKNFTDAELRDALWKGKQIYEKEHPETVHGGRSIKGKKGFKTKEEVVEDQNLQVVSHATCKVIEKEIEPADRYTKNLSENLKIPERTLRTHIRAKQAIVDNKVPKDLKEESTYKIVKHLREEKKKQEKKNPEKAKKTIIKKEKKENINLCNICKKVIINNCPHCNKMYYKCKEMGDHKFGKKQCEYFERRIS